MIELRNICKSYMTRSGPNTVIDNLSLHIPACQSIGILGRNGAGKSTLLRIIGGAELPDSGKVIRRGRVSWPIGFTGGFNTTLSGEENCRFVARIYGQDVDYVVESTREFADIGAYFDMPVRTYSSGMRARLAFALSMAIDFDIYLVDEVTAVGDKHFREKCTQAFAERRGRSSIIIVSHQLATLKQYCDRYAVLIDGRMHLCDELSEATALYQVEKEAA